ncbi:MAG: carbon starvation protein A [Candidatus Edwardsbacteria bacterium]
MNILFLLLTAIPVFFLAYRVYAYFIARNLGEDPHRPTPAVAMKDGRDYVPTKLHVLFAHHFSAIAGAGPIVGPTMAVLYGYLPAWLWVVLGGIFIGAVHDFTSLFVSIQEKGKSMAEIARKTMGQSGFALFILFTIVMIVLVTSSFLSAIAISLTSEWPIAKLGLSPNQTLLRMEITSDGTVLGRIGGIASTSVIIITLFAPFLGFLIYKRRVPIVLAYLIAFVVGFFSILIGIAHPVTLSANVWMVIISFYVFFAAGLPVWLILQPRDFINVQILYGGIIIFLVSIVAGGLQGMRMNIPPFNLAEGAAKLGFVWPMLFITVACGAISGFHALVAGGTTSKQISNEADAKRIGYGGMLLESTVAVCTIIALGSGLAFMDYKSVVWPSLAQMKSNPVLGFSLAMGGLVQKGIHIPVALGAVFGILLVEGFVITTLDAAVRLNRYLFEELWNILFKNPPAFLKWYWFNSGLAVFLMWLLAYKNAFSAIWPVFGTANQLLAALSLVAISVWLLLRKKKAWFVIVPAFFMLATTLASLLILLVKKYLPTGNLSLIIADLLLLFLSLGALYVAGKTYGTLNLKFKI